MLAQKLLSAMAGGEEKLYVDDVFSTYLYTGNGSTQTINNGIDLAGKGGLVWTKSRSGAFDHTLYDTVRGATNGLFTNGAFSNTVAANGITSFGPSGYSIGSYGPINTATNTHASWTFRKAPKFFDVVTWTGDGVTNRQITHALEAYPGCIIVKRLDATANWKTYHVTSWSGGVPVTFTNMQLNTTDAGTTAFTGINANGRIVGNGTTAITLQAGSSSITDVNANGATYVAYLFAHDPSADGIIQCGSFTADANGNATVNLGWEPQYVMVKFAAQGSSGATSGGWAIYDSMRRLTVNGSNLLLANSAGAELSDGEARPTSTGFTQNYNNASIGGATYIYLAIRRSNKPPTTGTQVYNAIARTGGGATVAGVGFAPDLVFSKRRDGGRPVFYDKLRGAYLGIISSQTDAEWLNYDSLISYTNNGITVGADTSMASLNYSGLPYSTHFFRRAPGFFDVVCYQGTGVAKTEAHGLGVVPELMIVKSRTSGLTSWFVYDAALGATKSLFLEQVSGPNTSTTFWNDTAPTANSFTLGSSSGTNASGGSFVAYLFATKAGISKVGSYTGNGSTQTINCGFSTGARFFLVKATSTTGSWWVFDSVRGVVAAADPVLALNSTAAEITSADAVDPASVGLVVNQEATCSINANGVSYIYLAIA